MTGLRPAWLEIDLGALAHNVRLHRRAAGPDCRFFAVVKGDGYGVGVVESARTALAAGADALALGNPDEIATLRQAGVSAPILLYASSLPEDAAAIADVGRLGFLPGAAEAAFRRLAAARHDASWPHADDIRPVVAALKARVMRRGAGRRTPCADPEPTRHRAYRDLRHASAAGRDRRRSRRARASGLEIDQRGGDRGHHGRRHAGTRGAPRLDGAPAISAGSPAGGGVRGRRITLPGPRKGNP
jgi:Alanine racemase, N-terminal domain